MFRFAFLLLALCWAAAGQELTIHVSREGDDSWNGRALAHEGNDGPVRSLSKALERVRGQAGSARIVLEDGRYELEQPVTVTEADGRSGNDRLTIEAAPNARPEL